MEQEILDFLTKSSIGNTYESGRKFGEDLCVALLGTENSNQVGVINRGIEVSSFFKSKYPELISARSACIDGFVNGFSSKLPENNKSLDLNSIGNIKFNQSHIELINNMGRVRRNTIESNIDPKKILTDIISRPNLTKKENNIQSR